MRGERTPASWGRHDGYDINSIKSFGYLHLAAESHSATKKTKSSFVPPDVMMTSEVTHQPTPLTVHQTLDKLPALLLTFSSLKLRDSIVNSQKLSFQALGVHDFGNMQQGKTTTGVQGQKRSDNCQATLRS